METQNQVTKFDDSLYIKDIYNINIKELDNIDTLFIQYESSRTDNILNSLIQTKKTKTVKYETGIKEKLLLTSEEISKRKEVRKAVIKRCMENSYSENRLLYDSEKEQIINVVCSCKSKYCPYCQRRLQKVTRGRLIDFVEGFHAPRFCTVSLTSVTHLTADYIKTASLEFELMRKFLKREGFTFGNYVSVLEIVLHEKYDPYYIYEFDMHGKAKKVYAGTYLRKNWNVHFHIIYDGDFIPQHLASEMLKKATKGRSKYVYFEYISREDHNSVKSKRKALMYITKYITKQQIVTPNNERVMEYYEAIKNVKMVRVSGYKSIKKESKLKDYIKYLMIEGCMSYEEACIYRIKYLEVMKDYCMTKYDISLSLDENVLLYSIGSMKDICIGV